MKEDKILISSISSWEIAMLVSKKRLRLTMDALYWIAYCERLPFFEFIPADNKIGIKSVNLPGFSYNDPADRIIVATAMTEGATLFTKDRKLLDYSEVRSVW